MLKERNQIEIQQKLQKEMQKNNLDALIITSPEAIFYATGYASSFSYSSNHVGLCIAVVPSEGKCTLICSQFEEPTVKLQCKDINVVSYPTWIFIDDLEDDNSEKPEQPDINITFKIVSEIINDLKGKEKVGIQSINIPYSIYEYLKKAFRSKKLVDCEKLLRKVRSVKTEWEIKNLKKVAQITEKAMYETFQKIKPGMSEAEIVEIYREAGHSQSVNVTRAYMGPSIGENYSTMLIPRDIKVKEGDIIRLDGGFTYFGYQSDLGRTFCIGEPTNHYKKIYKALYTGFEKAMNMIGPAVKMSEVFDVVQNEVRNFGLEKFTRGHFGHCIGTNTNPEEYPFIAKSEASFFESGMVFCVEVPYYSAISGGFVVEDELVITKEGYERFTFANSSLILK